MTGSTWFATSLSHTDDEWEGDLQVPLSNMFYELLTATQHVHQLTYHTPHTEIQQKNFILRITPSETDVAAYAIIGWIAWDGMVSRWVEIQSNFM